MAVIAQLVEHLVVVQRVAGSSPVDRPTFYTDTIMASKESFEAMFVSESPMLIDGRATSLHAVSS